MRCLPSAVLAAAALALATPLIAQQPASPKPSARRSPVVVLGTVLTPTGRPAVGVVAGLPLGPRDTTDTRGRFHLSLSLFESTAIHVYCRSATFFHARRLGTTTIGMARVDTLRLTMTVDPTLCIESAVDTLTSDFYGHWTTGFEESAFVPCPSSLPPGHGARQEPLSSIWAEMASDAAPFDSTRPLPAPDTSGYGNRHYVHVRGRLHGPGDFGHLGMAAYQLDVTDLLEIRTPAEDDCNLRPPPLYRRWDDSTVTVSAPTLMVVRGPEESAELAPRAHRVAPALGWVVVERGYDAAWMVTSDRMTVGPFHPRRLGYTLLIPGSYPQWLLDGEITSDAQLAAALERYEAAARGAKHGDSGPMH